MYVMVMLCVSDIQKYNYALVQRSVYGRSVAAAASAVFASL